MRLFFVLMMSLRLVSVVILLLVRLAAFRASTSTRLDCCNLSAWRVGRAQVAFSFTGLSFCLFGCEQCSARELGHVREPVPDRGCMGPCLAEARFISLCTV